MSAPTPPRFWRRLLEAAARPADKDALVGDLDEEHALRAGRDGAGPAGRWYRRQTLRSLAPLLAARWLTPTEDAGMLAALPDALARDVQQSLRSLRRSPGFSGVALLTIALGIGAATSIFAVVNGVLLRPLAYDEPDRLYRVGQSGEEGSYWVSTPNFEDMEAALPSLELAAFTPDGANAVVEGEPERVGTAEVTADFFDVLGVEPALGRAFTAEEQRTGAAVAVVSHGVWERRLGRSPDAVGRTLVLDGEARQIVGVLPPVPMIPADAEVFLPISLRVPDWRASRGIVWIQLVARLREGATPEAAREEAAALSSSLRAAHPDVNGELTIAMRSLEESLVGSVRTELRVLMAAVLLVLLVTGLNVGGLLLARASARSGETQVRAALGCGRPRLAGRFLIDGALLAGLGGLLGALLARVGVTVLVAQAPPGTPRLAEVGLSGAPLAFAAAAAAATALVAGVLPALQALRPRTAALRSGRGGVPRARVRGGLVVVQVALALALLTGAGLLGKSFWRLAQVDPGFDPTGVLVAGLPVVESQFASPEERAAHFGEMLAAAAALPGVESAALTNTPPFVGAGPFFSYELPGVVVPEDAQLLSRFRVVSPGLFGALRIPLLAGRTFTDEETRGVGERTALVSEELAEAHFGGPAGAVGREIHVAGEVHRIVGVVGAIRDLTLRQPSPAPHVYVAMSPATRQGMHLVLRTAGDPEALLPSLRDVVRRIDPTQPITPAGALAGFVSDSVARPRFTLGILSFFAGATVLLSALGLYGLLSAFVGGRTHEIGVRVALGAAAPSLRRMVVFQGMRLAALGLLAGAALALWAGRLLETLLYEVPATDPQVMAGVAGALLGVAALASWLPARRATRIQPSVALRGD